MTPELWTLEDVQRYLKSPSRKAAWRWLRRHGIKNRETGRQWRVFNTDVVAEFLRDGEKTPVDHVQEGEKTYVKHFGDGSWTRH